MKTKLKLPATNIVTSYLEGASARKIAEQLGVSTNPIFRCLKENGIQLRNRGAYSQKCELNGNWKGGRCKNSSGYILIRLSKDDFFHPMADNNNCVREHRLVMAKALGRCLHPWEIVHHKGTIYPKGSIENKQDNRIENLQLVTDDRHKQITILENRIKWLEQRVLKLEVENSFLVIEIGQLRS